MSVLFKIRDKFYSPIEKIRKTNIKQGDFVLDYGCGPGSYTVAAAEVIGSNGKVFAADIHPLALVKVKKKARTIEYDNIETIQTDYDTGLDNESINVVICFEMFHGVLNKKNLIKKFHRVLKPNSMLSFDDHKMKEDTIIDFITSDGLFKLSEKKGKQYNFIKI
jgi:ubiquinone/menaquinone biosynthesis C-methylase UbiE